jgi:hypothetical protein
MRDIQKDDYIDIDEDMFNAMVDEITTKAINFIQNDLQNKRVVSQIEDANGYWISPDGKILSDFRVHIQAIIDSPESFGSSKDEIDKLYKKYKEPMGFEGKARQQLMEQAIARGWIRIRYYPKNDQFSVELSRLDTRRKDYLSVWAKELLSVNPKRKYTEIKITELANAMNVTSVPLAVTVDRFIW